MNATVLAEQATLGALILAPTQAHQVTGWLRAGDFSHPWHEAIYTMIRERLAAREPIDPVAVGHALVARHGHARADLSRFAGLLEVVPPRGEPGRYAVMVLESALRREVTGYGMLLQAGAMSAQLAGQAGNLTRITTLVETALNAGAARWAEAHGHLATGEVTHPQPVRLLPRRTPERACRDAATGADRLLRAHPPRDKAAVAVNERELIVGLIRHPEAIGAVAAWLRPEAMTDATWRPVYAALVHLADLGQAVDQVTVAWEVHRAERRRGRGPDLRDLRNELDTTPAIEAGHASRLVAGDQLRQLADHAAQALRTAAANPGLEVTDLFATGQLMTAALADLAHVLPRNELAAEPRRTLIPLTERRAHQLAVHRSVGPVAR